MRRLLCALFLMGLVTPALAQSPERTGFAFVSGGDLSGDETLIADGAQAVEFVTDQMRGFGAGVRLFWSTRLATELSVSILESDAELRSSDLGASLGSLRMIPVAAALQYHFAPDARFAPFLGGGVAYVVFDELESPDLKNVGIEVLELDDELGLIANAGVKIRFTDQLSLLIDGKFIALESSISESGEDPLDVELNPLILSAGLEWRF